MSTGVNSDDLVDIGEQRHKAGQLQEAESYYLKALEIDPGHPGARYYLANIAYDDGRLPLATQLTEALLHEQSDDAEAWHLLGMIALKEADTARARECFTKALAIQPSYAQAHYSLGNVLNSQGHFDAALASLQRALQLQPAFAEAHYSLANIYLAQNKSEEALSSYHRAISAASDFRPAYEGIGGILLSQERLDDAITIYRKAIAENAGSALIYVGLGIAHERKEQTADAASNFERAIAMDPNCFLAHVHLGNLFYKHGKFNEAAESLKQASALKPQDTQVLDRLAKTYLYFLGENDQAAEVYRRLLALEPDNPVAKHHLASCSGQAIPPRAEEAYVEHIYDEFAEKFDSILGQLGYCGPQLVAAAMQRECGTASKQFAILDAGCGTGLCGSLLASYAMQLTGVDLSAGMLAKAKLRNVYDELIKAELTTYLQSKSDAFDVIMLADTLIYFGDVQNLFTRARAATHKGGYLFLTAEAYSGNSGPGYHLQAHGRYSHSEAYLRQTLSDAGYTIVATETATLRYESRLPVQSFVLSCRAA